MVAVAEQIGRQPRSEVMAMSFAELQWTVAEHVELYRLIKGPDPTSGDD